MGRLVLTDAHWAKTASHCLGNLNDPGCKGRDNRLFAEAILRIVRTGSLWRELPDMFGHRNTLFNRHRDRVKADVFSRLFDAVPQ